MSQVHRAPGAQGQGLAQRLAHALGPEAEDDDLATLLFGDLQRLFQSDLVALVDRKRQILFVDPPAILADAQPRFGIRHLFDADGNLHLGNPLGKCGTSWQRYARPDARVNDLPLPYVKGWGGAWTVSSGAC